MTFVYDFNPQWIAVTLRTIASNHQNLQAISVQSTYMVYEPVPFDLRDGLGEESYTGWLELDHSSTPSSSSGNHIRPVRRPYMVCPHR